MAIISMSDNDPSKKAEKKWVAKATINRIIEIKEKQKEEAVELALDMQQEIFEEMLEQLRRELKEQTHLKNVFLCGWAVTTLVLLWWMIYG